MTDDPLTKGMQPSNLRIMYKGWDLVPMPDFRCKNDFSFMKLYVWYFYHIWISKVYTFDFEKYRLSLEPE